MLQNVQSFGVGSHQAIFDSIVDHLHEVTCSRWAAVEITFLSRSTNLLAAGSTVDVSAARRERFEDGVEVFHDVQFSANHLAVPALKSPDAAAGADVAIVDAFCRQFFSAADIINVVGISTVDDDVA